MAVTTTKPTVVIVHGAWTDGSSFAEVQGILTVAGHNVLDFANPLRSLTGDVAYLAAFLQTRTAGPVILVGHSYGGALIGAAGLKASNVVGLVYVGAFIPIEGESLLGLLSSAGPVDPSQLFDMVPYPGAPDGDVACTSSALRSGRRSPPDSLPTSRRGTTPANARSRSPQSAPPPRTVRHGRRSLPGMSQELATEASRLSSKWVWPTARAPTSPRSMLATCRWSAARAIADVIEKAAASTQK